MPDKIHNSFDVLRDKTTQAITGDKRPSALGSASSAGASGAGSFGLTFLDPATGAPRKWFKFGRHTFDDDTAIFY